MSEYLQDIEQYTDSVREPVVKGIVKHLGIALRSRDASLVACSDQAELELVRESFLKKKLGLDNNDSELDFTISEVCNQMKNDKNKSRVTFYYLLTEKFDKFALFE